MKFLLFIALAATLATDAFGTKLEITHASVQQYEDGPPVFRPDTFTAGEVVHFNFLVEGFGRKEDKVNLSYEAQPADAAGVPLTPVVTGKLVTALAAEDKDWLPKLRGNFNLPGVLLPGQYSIAVRLKDEISGATAQKDILFLVGGVKLSPSAELAVLNVDFYRNEDDVKPLQTPAFRVGEEMHVKFQIAGFRHDEKGAMHVSYGVSIADSTGRVLLEEPSAAQDDNSDFYAKPYVPGILSLTLKPGTSLGEYTLILTAHDAVANQKAEVRRTFRIE